MNEHTKASALRIQIKRQQVITVDLKFPIFTLTVMENFIPEKAQTYLRNSSIDIPSILRRIEDSNYKPQSVLNFEHEEKNFTIWIE
jgi:hypothetical protein